MFSGGEGEEELYPSFTPLDSIPVCERIALIETVICSPQTKYVYDVLSFLRRLSLPPFGRQITERANSFNCLQLLGFIANYRSSNAQSVLGLEASLYKALFETLSTVMFSLSNKIKTYVNYSSREFFLGIFIRAAYHSRNKL